MMLQRIFLALVFLTYTYTAFSQTNDPILFKVGNTPVHVSEFQYIYSKTNGDKADFSEASLKEYLGLYSKFKLKVERARDMKLDTIQALKKELAGYRRQLSKNYLLDREVMEKLLREAYERKKKDVSISHILVKVPQNAPSKVVDAASKKIRNLKKQLVAGKSFAQLARDKSEDESSKASGGKIGYITALQLPGFYEIETAAYTTPVGEVSDPIRSRLGFHLIRVDENRPARGEIEVAHILVRVSDKSAEEAKAQALINKIYRQLQDGKKFEELAKAHSSDEQTKQKGGHIGYMGIGAYENVFEEAAFSISKDGKFSRPFRSSIGWHIIKRISKKSTPPYEEVKGLLQNQIRRDSRFQIVQKELINRIKKEAKFKEVDKAKNAFFGQLDPSFLTQKWKEPNTGQDVTLFSLANQTVTLKNFIQYLRQNPGARVREARTPNTTPQKIAQKLLDQFIQQRCLAYEEGQLETKYPEFKALMREYREGILLFEVTKRLVWDKASLDTIGLAAYYENNKNKYQWNERADATTYMLKSTDEKLVKKFQKIAKKKAPKKVLKKINKKGEVLSFERNSYERGKNKMVDAVVWKKGMLGSPWKEGDVTKYIKIEKVIAPKPKSLKEARGYVVADYQDYLEKTWVEELNRSYQLKIEEATFKSLIKK